MQAKGSFNDVIYTQLIAIIGLAVKKAMITNDNFEMEFVSPYFNSFFFHLVLLLLCSMLFHQCQEICSNQHITITPCILLFRIHSIIKL